LARKTGRFYGRNERERVEVDQWLFWQMAGLGPMGGQANHFRVYSPAYLKDQRTLAYGANRYSNEVRRLWGVFDQRLIGRDYVAGDISIADMACWPWMRTPQNQGVDPEEFPHVKAWCARIAARPAAIKAVKDGEALRLAALSPEGAGKAEEPLSLRRARG
jgi:glutathione S-transferase/GST-like protein